MWWTLKTRVVSFSFKSKYPLLVERMEISPARNKAISVTTTWRDTPNCLAKAVPDTGCTDFSKIDTIFALLSFPVNESPSLDRM